MTDITHMHPHTHDIPARTHQILVDDGLISLTVIEKKGEDVKCRVNNSGDLGGRKGVNLPGNLFAFTTILPEHTHKPYQYNT